MKKNIIILLLFLAAVIIGSLYVSHLHSQVKYVDEDCPFCGSCEVLDFGTDNDGNQLANCYDCSARYIIIKQ